MTTGKKQTARRAAEVISAAKDTTGPAIRRADVFTNRPINLSHFHGMDTA